MGFAQIWRGSWHSSREAPSLRHTRQIGSTFKAFQAKRNNLESPIQKTWNPKKKSYILLHFFCSAEYNTHKGCVTDSVEKTQVWTGLKTGVQTGPGGHALCTHPCKWGCKTVNPFFIPLFKDPWKRTHLPPHNDKCVRGTAYANEFHWMFHYVSEFQNILYMINIHDKHELIILKLKF